MHTQGIWLVTEKDEQPKCPQCSRAVKSDGSVYEQRLMTRRGVPVDFCSPRPAVESVWEKALCATYFCPCGVRIACDVGRNANYCTFRCVQCDCYRPELSKRGTCFWCVVDPTAAARKWECLSDELAPSQPMGRHKSETMDSLLRGLLIGAPGLTVEDP